jgi:hypothetical protein
MLYLKGVNESIRSHLDELYLSVRAIGLDAPEGTLEARIRKFLLEFYDLAVEVPQKPQVFESRVPEILASLPEDLLTTQQLAPRQVQLVWDVMDFATIVLDYMAALRNYLEIRKLSDRLVRLLEASEKTEIRDKMIARIRKISSPELVVLFSLMSSMLCPLATELKNMDEYLTNCRRMKRMLVEEEKTAATILDAVGEQSLSADSEKDRVEREIQRVRPLFSSPGTKRRSSASEVRSGSIPASNGSSRSIQNIAGWSSTRWRWLTGTRRSRPTWLRTGASTIAPESSPSTRDSRSCSAY